MMKVNRSAPVILHPSEPTPTVPYFLSNLDQNLPVLIKTIHFFPSTARRSISSGDDHSISNTIRTSLQKVLVQFYPFIGRLSVTAEGKLFVRFDGDDGVPFVEATAESSLKQLGDISVASNSENLLELVYSPQPADSVLQLPLLAVQLTEFKCGGYSIGLVINHSIADGVSIIRFRRAWAETARGRPLSQAPPFLDRSILRPSQPPEFKVSHPEYLELSPYISGNPSNTVCIRRFVFDPAKLSRLKQLGSTTGQDRPSTFTSLAGFIWFARTKALNIPLVEPIKLLFPVDIRNRVEPHLPQEYFGNGFVFACCHCPAGLLMNRPFNHAVEMLEETIRGVTNRFVRSTIDFFELTRSRPSLAGTFIITSWSRLGIEPMDFGFGPSSSVELAELFVRELAVFRPYGRHGESISITLALPSLAMHAFEMIMDF